jgi:hypothetical protein
VHGTRGRVRDGEHFIDAHRGAKRVAELSGALEPALGIALRGALPESLEGFG